MTTTPEWQKNIFFDPAAGFLLDLDPAGPVNLEHSGIENAFTEMDRLESGEIANPDENRMVGHYWLRDPKRAPAPGIRAEIEATLSRIRNFASDVHAGRIAPSAGGKFRHVLVVGIGGSALGPQFVNKALKKPQSPMDLFFFDNTDPDGMSQAISEIPDLSKTLVIVISKSGGTKETKNGQLAAKDAFIRAGLPFEKHFVAVTGAGSELDRAAEEERWIARFPMWDWVGGRTSETSAVGLLPAALQGIDIDQLLAGARHMDELTRRRDVRNNPAAMLSLAWYSLGKGCGERAMVVLPYSDRLELFSRYLQQLVMESLGKELDRDGKVVNQGISVYGNKGSTDQHAYVQQLRDGLNNFFVIFIEVLKDPHIPAAFLEVEDKVTAGDYLAAFLQGTRKALSEKGRPSITAVIESVTPFSVGMLIALFERAVGLYASLININAYHQPGVEAGKKAAGKILNMQRELLKILSSQALTAAEAAEKAGAGTEVQSVFYLLRRLAENGRIRVEKKGDLSEWKFGG